MPEQRYPTEREFWQRLQRRGLEEDLQEELQRRSASQGALVQRLGRAETVLAVVERMLPGSAVPANAIASFLDQAFDKQMGRGDERTGVMPRAQLMPAGFQELDSAAGGSFASLDDAGKDRLLADFEVGQSQGPPGFDSSTWFKRVRDLILLAFGSDPRGMIQMGYPGPSYKPGHVWLTSSGARARIERKPGYMEL